MINLKHDFRIIFPYVESCALAYPDVKVVIVKFEEHIALAQEHQIRLVPTFMFVDENSKVVGKVNYRCILFAFLFTSNRLSKTNFPKSYTMFHWVICHDL